LKQKVVLEIGESWDGTWTLGVAGRNHEGGDLRWEGKNFSRGERKKGNRRALSPIRRSVGKTLKGGSFKRRAGRKEVRRDWKEKKGPEKSAEQEKRQKGGGGMAKDSQGK